MNETLTSRILIVDDEENILNAFRRLLRRERYDVDCTTLPREALEKVNYNQYAIVISDYNMVGMTGTSLLEQVKEKAPHTVRILITGYAADARVATEAINRGAVFRFLAKPWNDTDFMQMIRVAMLKYESDNKTTEEQAKEEREEEQNPTGAGLQAEPDGPFDQMIDKNADSMVVVKSDGTICFVNKAAETLFDRTKEDLVGQKFGFETETGVTSEIAVIQRDGHTKIGQMRLSLMEWENQNARLATIRDITEVKKTERLRAQIVEQQRLSQIKDEFISTVSHEMRTPLTIINGAVHNMIEGVAGELGDKQTHLMKIAASNVSRLKKIIDNLLDLSRLESGKIQIHPIKINTREFINTHVGGFQLIAKEKNIIIESDISEGAESFVADADMMGQVLCNLVGNSLRYAKSRILVSVCLCPHLEQQQGDGKKEPVSPSQPGVLFCISDDGPGIPEEETGRLFQRFVQINRPSGGAGYKGTGLGLVICKVIVELHQGKIWVESDEGQGARFCFVLGG